MDWITVIILLLILGVLADGFRRVRNARRAHLRLSRRARELGDGESIRVSSSEFPSGGARVVTRREQEEADNLNSDVKKAHASSRVTVGAPRRPVQNSLNLEDVVPMLMDPLEAESPEPDIVDDSPGLGDMQDLDEKPPLQARAAPDKSTTANKPRQREKDHAKEDTEVLIVSVMARPGERFQGKDLLQALMEVNMKFGEMDIFHRYEEEDGEGEVYFSLANVVVPGTFNLAEMENFSTPGVSLFMQLPLHPECESLRAFDIFAAVARALATRLSGDLKDENRSVMTSQTFEHYRQRIIDFERRKRIQAG